VEVTARTQAASAGPVYSRRQPGKTASKCQAPLRLIALIKTEDVAKKILTAMHLPTEIPELHSARPPPRQPKSGEDWVN
jgi:hypothetical protein